MHTGSQRIFYISLLSLLQQTNTHHIGGGRTAAAAAAAAFGYFVIIWWNIIMCVCVCGILFVFMCNLFAQPISIVLMRKNQRSRTRLYYIL